MSGAGGCYYLPVLHQPSNACSLLIAPLLDAEQSTLDHAHETLRKLTDHLLTTPDVTQVLPMLLATIAAISSVDQDSILTANTSAEGGLIAANLLTSSMLVPLLRKASRLSDMELSSSLIETAGVLTSLLSGHGEHTMRIGLGRTAPALKLRCVPQGWCTGTRLWPAARLAIGACCAGWEGLCVEGASVIEIGCGTAACGLACAALGARTVWMTDWDEDALALAQRNAEHNGLEATCHTAKLDFMRGFVDEASRPAAMPATFDLLLAADVLYDWGGSWRETLDAIACYLDASKPNARAICVFGQQKRSEAAHVACEDFERAARRGDAGLRCVAVEDVREEGREEGIRMLLLAPSTTGRDA